MNRVLTMLGLAVKAGSVSVGEEPVGAAARAKKARVVLLAQDAAPSSRRRAMSFAAAGGCLCLTIPADKGELGKALGHNGACAMCAVTDALFASAVAEKLKAVDAEKFGPAAAALAVKARRAVERRQEQARHLRNLKQGKRRVRAPAKETAAQEAPAEKLPPANAAADRPPCGESPACGERPRPQSAPHSERPERGDGVKRPDGPARAPRGDRPDRSEKPERPARPAQSRPGAPRPGAPRGGKTYGGKPASHKDGAHAAGGDKSRRPFPRREETEKPRYAGALPVKKGKGSKKSK